MELISRDRSELYLESNLLNIALRLEHFFKESYIKEEGHSFQESFEEFMHEVSEYTGIPVQTMVKIWNAEHTNLTLKECSKIKSFYTTYTHEYNK